MATDKLGQHIAVGDVVDWRISIGRGFSQGRAEVVRIDGDNVYLDPADLHFSKEIPVAGALVTLVSVEGEG